MTEGCSGGFYDHRKIGREHFAFYRGWLQGMELSVLADLYLEEATDLRVAKSTLTWLKDAFCNAALRQGRKTEAKLLRLHLRHVVAALAEDEGGAHAVKPPSLEDFREAEDPDGFYTERELISLYTQAFPETVDRRKQKRRNLIERQLSALNWLEPLIKTTPVREDFIAAWFHETLAKRLLLSELSTLGDLLDRIDEQGYHWYKSVERLGEKGAKRIVQWLRSYERELGNFPAHALLKPRAKTTSSGITALTFAEPMVRRFDIAPLELFQAPVELSGFGGINRLPTHPSISARSDQEAIEAWIAAKSGSPHTARNYRKEAERLLLWSAIERRKAISDLTVEDCTAYRDWLSMLGRTAEHIWPFNIEQARWIGKRHTPRTDKRWRPFDGPLSLPSVKQAMTILRGLFHWLVEVRYCLFNPWDAVNKKPVVTAIDLGEVELTRVLSETQWDFLLDVVLTMEQGIERTRLVFALAFAYTTGLRISELVAARTGHLYSKPIPGEMGQRWMLKVQGKGGKLRAVPISDEVLEALKDYLVERGISGTLSQLPPETPLLAHLITNETLSHSGLAWIMKTTFEHVAERMRLDGHEDDALHVVKASTHWLRHSRGSHLANSGFPTALIQKLLGHKSLNTTGIYTASSEDTLYHALREHDAIQARR